MAGHVVLTAELVARLDAMRARTAQGENGRTILGITGPPGSGKTTLARAVLAHVPGSAWVPMDGFHLADAELDRLGRRVRKGAIDTFDAGDTSRRSAASTLLHPVRRSTRPPSIARSSSLSPGPCRCLPRRGSS